MHYTQEQIDRANAVSLEDFLRSQGEELIKSGSEYRWKKHDSLTVCENKWFRHSQSKGGFPVDFVMEFYDKSFPEAVALLLNDTGYSPDRNEPQFRLPARSDSKEAAYRYLSEKRKIAPSLLDVFFKAGDIFEDAAHRNVVFIGRDKDGIPRCAHARGMEDQSRRDVSGSDKSCGFSYRGSGNQLFVFEAPIDLLSFICLYPDKWMQRSYVSLGGVSGKALDRFLSESRDIRKVFLCTDNDEAGNAAALRLAQTVADGIEVVRFTPVMKDWNEVLCHADQFPNRRYHAESSTLKEAGADDSHERCCERRGGMALEALYPLWQGEHFAGQSRRRQDLLRNAACSDLHEQKAASLHGRAGAVQYDLPDRRGRLGRYGASPSGKNGSRP